jgi:hypothetical protein
VTREELREEIKKAASDYQSSERRLCDLLSAVDQCRFWQAWGFSSLAHYAEDELGLSHRKALELLRVSASLQALPKLSRAFREEGVPFSKVREATRVATPGTDAEWARKVVEKPYRQIEQEVFSSRRAQTVTLKLEMTMDEYDRFDRAVEAVRRRRGRGTTLNQCLDLLASTFLTLGPSRDGSSGYPAGGQTAPFTQVIYRCERCERAEVQTRKGSGGVSDETLRLAACDSVILRDGKRVRREIPLAISRAVWTRARGCCESCGQRGWLHLHHRSSVEEGGKHSADNLVLLCSACHRAEHREGVVSPWASEAGRASGPGEEAREGARKGARDAGTEAVGADTRGRSYPRGHEGSVRCGAAEGEAKLPPRGRAQPPDHRPAPPALVGSHTRAGMEVRE